MIAGRRDDLSFPDRYVDPLPIRSRGAFHILSAKHRDGGRPCVLVLPGSASDPARIAEALAIVADAHSRIDHPLIPRVADHGMHAGTPFLEFDCDAIVDGHEVLRLVAESELKIPYQAADAFIASLREALQAAHATIDPRTGGPLCIGRISAGNTLYNREGRWFLVGLGHNFPVAKQSGLIDGEVTFAQAPELATGGAPTPMGDYVALLLFARWVMPYVEMSDEIKRILRGDFKPSDMELIENMQWVEHRVLGELPSKRATMEEAIAVANRIRALQGSQREPDSFAAHVAQLVRQNEEPVPIEGAIEPAVLTVTLGPDATWVAGPDGARQKLGRAQRRIVVALVERHGVDAEAPLTRSDLLQAGWPGEDPMYEAGANRVYVTLNRLRSLGLRDVIERFEDGYRLAPRAIVRRTL